MRKSQAELNRPHIPVVNVVVFSSPAPVLVREAVDLQKLFFTETRNTSKVTCVGQPARREKGRRWHRWDKNILLHFRGCTCIFEMHILRRFNYINKQELSERLAVAKCYVQLQRAAFWQSSLRRFMARRSFVRKNKKSVIRAQELRDLNSCVYVHVLSAVNFSGLTASPGRHEYMIMWCIKRSFQTLLKRHAIYIWIKSFQFVSGYEIFSYRVLS